MNPPPKGWPRISTAVFYDDAGAAIDWLAKAFQFEIRLRVEGEGGRIEYSELEFHGGLVSPSSTKVRAEKDNAKLPARSPQSLPDRANTQALCVVVDDCDAHCAHARAHGAKIVMEPTTTDYGDDYWADRTYQAEDLEGHHWWFMQRIRDKSE